MIVFKYCDFRTFIQLNDKNGPYNIIVFRYCKQSLKAEEKKDHDKLTYSRRWQILLYIKYLSNGHQKKHKLCLHYLIFLDYFFLKLFISYTACQFYMYSALKFKNTPNFDISELNQEVNTFSPYNYFFHQLFNIHIRKRESLGQKC